MISEESPTIPASLAELAEFESKIPIIPQVAARLLNLTSESGANMLAVERVVGADPVLAARVLALANSQAYGLPGQVVSLHEALKFVGTKSIHTLLCDNEPTPPLPPAPKDVATLQRRLWRHSLNTALCAEVITPRLNQTARSSFTSEVAVTVCLLHDIGKQIMCLACPSAFMAAANDASTKGQRMHEVEFMHFPYNHAMAGAVLSTRWNLPRTVTEVIAFHHTPLAAQVNTKLTSLACFANEVAHALENPDHDAAQLELVDRCTECAIPLRLNPESMRVLTDMCRAEVATAPSPLS